jgi:hypothetical protein
MSDQMIVTLIKMIHTLVFLVASLCVLYTLRCGIVGEMKLRRLRFSILLPSVIFILWLINGHKCILASLVYYFSGGNHSVSDIYLPEWLASRIMPYSTAVMSVAISLILFRMATNNCHKKEL